MRNWLFGFRKEVQIDDCIITTTSLSPPMLMFDRKWSNRHKSLFKGNLTRFLGMWTVPKLEIKQFLLSPPVHIAWLAHMHRFLSVRQSVRHWIIIHISESIIAMNLKLNINHSKSLDK